MQTAQTPGALPAGLLSQLLMLLGIPAPLGALEEACRKTQAEATGPVDQLGRILTAVKRRNARAALLRWDRFDHRQVPALLWRQGNWWLAQSSESIGFIRLTAVNGKEENLSADELIDAVVLWVQATGQQSPARFQIIRSQAIRLLLTEILRSKRWIGEVLVATIVINLMTVATSLFSMQVYDRVVPSFAYATLWALVVGMGITVVLEWILKIIRSRILDSVAKEVDERMSQHLFEHLMQMRLDVRPNSIGTMAGQVNGLESVRAFFSSSIVFALTDFPFALFFIACIIAIGGSIGVVYLLLLVAAMALGAFSRYQLRELSRQEIRRSHERHGLLVDTIQGAETILSTGAEWRFAEQWREVTSSIAGFSLKSRLLSSITQTSTGTIGTVAYVAAIVVGILEIEAGRLTMGGLIACTLLGGRVIAPAAQVVQILTQWQNVSESLEMVDGLLASHKTRSSERELLTPEITDVQLLLEGVQFAYPGSPILRLNIKYLALNPGERIAVLGANGSGKSTLLKIVGGLYKPTSGQVGLGGVSIWELNPQILNQWIAYLPQEVHLFKGTLRTNMTVAGGISDARVLAVAKQLGIDRIAADSPRGMDTEISEGGQGLSGGQKQLIAISRIFLAAPRVWLLDEPTAALDDEAELRFIDAFKQQIKSDDIVLFTTHRPRMIALANRLLVMRGGQIVSDEPPAGILKQLQPEAAAPKRTITVTATSREGNIRVEQSRPQ